MKVRIKKENAEANLRALAAVKGEHGATKDEDADTIEVIPTPKKRRVVVPDDIIKLSD